MGDSNRPDRNLKPPQATFALSPNGTSGSCPIPIWLRVLGQAGHSRVAPRAVDRSRSQVPEPDMLGARDEPSVEGRVGLLGVRLNVR